LLETIYFLDSRAIPKGGGYTRTPVIWLIEEPEAFLYEDLVQHVGRRLATAAAQTDWTVCVTTHERELAMASEGRVHWVELGGGRGSQRTWELDLSRDDADTRLAEQCRKAYGTGVTEAALLAEVERLRQQLTANPWIVVVEGKHDETIIARLIEIGDAHHASRLRVVSPIRGPEGAAWVSSSVRKLADVFRDARVVGLSDNDYEGCEHHGKLLEAIQTQGLAQVGALLIPETRATKNAPRGELVDAPGHPRTAQTNQTVDLAGRSLTIEALYDEPAIEKRLISEGCFFEHWVADPGHDRVRFTRLVNDGKKGKAASTVAGMLRRGRLGSLARLWEEIVGAF
jgi:5S rRNA maturation endonuclease (ribonuclease M5)